MEKVIVRKSVRELVEGVLITGSIDTRYTSTRRAQQGIIAHKKLQESNMSLYERYEKEVSLEVSIEQEEYVFLIQGRCDGIIYEGNNVIIEEIKSTYKPLFEIEDSNIIHWAQAKLYGYMHLLKENKQQIFIQLSYYNIDSNEVKTFRNVFQIDELRVYTYDLLNEYMKFGMLDKEHKLVRIDSINKLNFPFSQYRKGQYELAKYCFNAIRENEKFFVQAPTGIGKTISTLFPAIKCIGVGSGERIFYLTSKNTNKRACKEAVDILRKEGLIIRDITITAKEKACLNDKIACNPDECKYAKDYYDKIKYVIPEIINNEKSLTKEIIERYSEKNSLCPFELSLDLINWCEIVICDYNYIFDPRIYLKRVLDEGGKENIALIDECHNLLDRGRDMYSATLKKSLFMQLMRESKGKYKGLYKACNKVNKYFIEEKHNCEGLDRKYFYTVDEGKELYKLLREVMVEGDKILSNRSFNPIEEQLLDVYFECSKFLSISELYGEEYYTIYKMVEDDFEIILFCANPAKKLRSVLDKLKASVLFSATLYPFHYYLKSIGGKEEDYRLRLQSPFSKENLKVYVHKLNTRYKYRKITLNKLCDTIVKFINKQKGNYIIFLPSYEYLRMVEEVITTRLNKENLLVQSSNMSEEDRASFIEEFKEGANKIGLCVLGGGFSEGVDLPGEKLIGVVVVGVGYPKISLEGELIKDYYKDEGELSAYIYPGINKVMQAAGRVIRRESDKGRVLLIDDRYLYSPYLQLLPREWNIRRF